MSVRQQKQDFSALHCPLSLLFPHSLLREVILRLDLQRFIVSHASILCCVYMTDSVHLYLQPNTADKLMPSIHKTQVQ